MFKKNPNCIVHLSSETGLPPIPIFDKKFLIGRKSTHVVAIPDNSISRDHLEVTISDQEILIKDLGTSNGTKLNGHSIASQIPIPYHEGQIITLGHSNVGIVIELFSKDKEKKKEKVAAPAIVIAPPPPEIVATPSATATVSPSFYGDPQKPANAAQPSYSAPYVVESPVSQEPPASQSSPYSIHQASPPLSSSSQSEHTIPLASMASAAPQLQVVPPVVAAQVVAQVDPAALNAAKDEANRILARAKIEGEMQVRELLKTRESEAQQIISQAQSKALEKHRETEMQTQEMMKAAHEQVQLILKKVDDEAAKNKEALQQEALKFKDSIVDEGRRMKESLVEEGRRTKEALLEEGRRTKETLLEEGQRVKEQQIQDGNNERNKITNVAFTERDQALKEIEQLKISIPAMKQQINFLQEEVNKYTQNRQQAELEYQKQSQKVQVANAELVAHEEQVGKLRNEFTQTQKALAEAEEKHKQVVLSAQNLINETQETLARTSKKEQELNALLDNARKTKDEADRYSMVTRQETDSEVQKKLAYMNEEIEKKTKALQIETETKRKQLDEEIEKKTSALKLETETARKHLNDEIEKKTTALQLETDSTRKQVTEELENKRRTVQEETDARLKNLNEETEKKLQLLNTETENKINFLNQETNRILADRENLFREMKQKQDTVLSELKQTEDAKMKSLLELDDLIRSKREALEKELNERIKALTSEYDRKRTELDTEYNNLRLKYDQEFNSMKDQRDREFNEVREKRDKEFKDLKLHQDAYLKEMKQNEEEKVRKMFEESQKYIKQQREIKLSHINEALENYFTELQRSASGDLGGQVPDLKQNVKKLVEEAVTNEYAGEESKIRKIMDFDPEQAAKHKKFWKKTMYWSAGAAVLIGYLVYKPSAIKEIPRQMEAHVQAIDQESKDQMKQQQEAIRLASIYRPEQDDTFKENYTDNVLFTRRYLDFEYNDKSYKEWVVIINKFLQDEVGMTDDAAMQFITNESGLIHNLETKKALIDGQKPETGIKAMRSLEDDYQKLIQSSLREKKDAYWKQKRNHYEKFLKENP